MYTITVDCYTVPLLSPYRLSTLGNMILIVFTKLNNNINEQLILGLGILMKETTSVLWVDLRYRLHSRLSVPLQDSGG